MAKLIKPVDELQKSVEKIIKETSKTVTKGTKDITTIISKEQKKVEIKSQIGQHKRNVTKAYARLGEAYFKHETEGATMEGTEDVMDILKSNLKVIRLLQDQLDQLEDNEK